MTDGGDLEDVSPRRSPRVCRPYISRKTF